MLKPLTMWIITNDAKLLERGAYQIILPVFWETCMQVKMQQLERGTEKRIASKLGKEYVKAIYCHRLM